jgi:hypothetical protein
MITHHAAGITQPVDRLHLSIIASPPLSPTISSVSSTLTDPHQYHAMEDEYATLLSNNTCDLVPCPFGANVVNE